MIVLLGILEGPTDSVSDGISVSLFGKGVGPPVFGAMIVLLGVMEGLPDSVTDGISVSLLERGVGPAVLGVIEGIGVSVEHRPLFFNGALATESSLERVM